MFLEKQLIIIHDSLEIQNPDSFRELPSGGKCQLEQCMVDEGSKPNIVFTFCVFFYIGLVKRE